MPKITPMLEFDKQLCERLFFSLPGLSDGQIGNLLGLKRQSVQGWRSGKSRPTMEQLNIISTESQISWRWFTTGRTTDHTSVSYAFFPIHYDKNKIAHHHAYNIAREISSQLLATSNDRLFLPILSHLIHNVINDPSSCEIINILDKSHTTKDYKYVIKKFNLNSTTQHTKRLYAEMRKSYIYLPDNNLLTTNENTGESELNNTNLAYTSLENITCNTTTKYTCNKKQIMIIGDNMSPIVSNKQIVTISPKIFIGQLEQNRKILVVVKLAKSYIKRQKIKTYKEVQLCRYLTLIDRNVILSDISNSSPPYLLTRNDITELYPVHSVLWN